MDAILSKYSRAAVCVFALMTVALADAQTGRSSIERQQPTPSGAHSRFAAIVARATDPRDRARFIGAVTATDATLARSSPALRAWVVDEGRRHSGAGDPATAGIARDARARFGGGLPRGDINAIVLMVLAQSARHADLLLRNELAQLQAGRHQQATTPVSRGMRQPESAWPTRSTGQPARTVAVPTRQQLSRHPTSSQIDVPANGLASAPDGMNDVSEAESLRLQELDDQRSKALETLSNIEKKERTTDDSILENMK